jgi:hypothetical protein
VNRSITSSVLSMLVVLGAACNPVLDVGHNEPGDAIVATDTPLSTCNVNDGTCRPGEGCSPDECTRCVCDDTHAWLCSATCADSGGPCPPSLPKNGSACPLDDVGCTYENGCHERDVAVCLAGSWQVFHGVCDPPPSCPRTPPLPGSPCRDLVPRCTWKNACGVSYSGYCDGYQWVISPPPCTPGACPTATPADRSPCSSFGLKCEWTTSCGTPDYGFCGDTGWSVKTTCTPMVCPAIVPAAGAPCATEGTKCSWSGGCDAGTYLEATCTYGKWMFTPGCR